MANKMDVLNIEISSQNANVYVDVEHFRHCEEIVPEGRMLADSEQISFIYILDIQGEYFYLNFPFSLWKKIKEAVDQQLCFYLHVGSNNTIHLIHMSEEVRYLISNIENNLNYGEKMVAAVSEIFSE